MKRLLCLLLIVLLLPVSGLAGEGSTTAFDYDLTMKLLWENFPEKEQKAVKGWADLLNLMNLTGSAAYRTDGNGSFDVNTKVSFRGEAEASTEFHLFGYDQFVFVDSPLIGGETFFGDLHGIMVIMLKMSDYFEYPFHDFVLALPSYWTLTTDGLVRAWNELLESASPEGVIANERIMEWADLMSTLEHDDPYFPFLNKAVGLESDFCAELTEELEGLPDWVDEIMGDSNALLVKDENTEKLMVGDRVLFERKTGNGTTSFQCHIPESGIYQYRFGMESNATETGVGTKLKTRLLLERENSENPLLDLKVTGENLPSAFPFVGDFTLTVDMRGDLKGDALLTVNGSRQGDELLVRIDCRLEKEADPVPVFEIRGRIREQEEPAQIYYSGSIFGEKDMYYVLSQNETSLGELEGRIAGPVIREVLPILVQLPASSCRSIMDFLSDHGIISFVAGHFNGSGAD